MRRLFRLALLLALTFLAASIAAVALYRVLPPAGDPADAATGGAGLRLDEKLAPARRDLAEPDARRDRRRGCPILPASRVRLGRDRGGLGALPAGSSAAGRRQHDLDADREKPVPVAGPRLAAQGARSLVHGMDRAGLEQAADYRGLSEYRRMGPRHLRRRGRRAALFQQTGRGADRVREAARLAAVLPDPLDRSARSPGPAARRHAAFILEQMPLVPVARPLPCGER